MDSTKAKERPILFSGPMVRAIIAGTKTVTRRIVEPMAGQQREWLTRELLDAVPHGEMKAGGWQMHHPKAGTVFQGVFVDHDSPLGWIRCPYGVPGDRLWVREAWAFEDCGEDGHRLIWQADRAAAWASDVARIAAGAFYMDADYQPTRWRPSIHMPRAFSRINLEIASVRAERLQDIADDDIRAEGVTPDVVAEMLDGKRGEPHLLDMVAPKPRDVWRLGWDAINGQRAPWSTNPWVWRVEFRRL
jgi:hypothetical protein